MAVVTSGAGVHMERSGAALSQAVAVQLTAQLGLPQPLAHFTIMEKQATLVPAPGLQRPGVRLPLARMYLAGDAADSDYPSTLEGSVRAGVRAAQAAIEDIARGR
jgi:hydroxysqualene dehydroxylase